jgi:hypothetical protein
VAKTDSKFHGDDMVFSFLTITLFDLESNEETEFTKEIPATNMDIVTYLGDIRYILGNSINKNEAVVGGVFDQLRIWNSPIDNSLMNRLRHQIIDLQNPGLIAYSLLASNETLRGLGLRQQSKMDNVRFI